MELYHKKIKIQKRPSKRERESYNMAEVNPRRYRGNSKNNDSTNIANILLNEVNRKKDMKNVLNIGKRRNVSNSPNSLYYEQKRPSPNYRAGQKYIKSSRVSPIERNYDERVYNDNYNYNYNYNNNYIANTTSNFYNPNISKVRQSNSQKRNNRYYDEEEYIELIPYYQNTSQEEIQNYYDLNASVDRNDQKYKYASPEPRIFNKYVPVLKETYEKSARRPYYHVRRYKDIRIPMQNRQNNNNLYSNNISNIINNTDEDDVEDLMRTIDELRSVIDEQKNEIKNNRNGLIAKNKEINR